MRKYGQTEGDQHPAAGMSKCEVSNMHKYVNLYSFSIDFQSF